MPLTKPNIRIRPFLRADLPHLVRLEAEAFDVDAWDRGLLEWYASTYPLMFLVAEDGSRLAGYCVARPTKPGYGEVDSIAVFCQYQRHGVGTALLRAAITRLRRRGAHTVSLMVRRDNARAIAFYRRNGFVRTRTVPNYYEDNATAWRMSASLAAVREER